MRKPVSFRFDGALLERARQHAVAENRTLTNYVETAVLRAVQCSEHSTTNDDVVVLAGGSALEDLNK